MLPIMMDPLLAGERKPTAAKTIRKNAQKMSCSDTKEREVGQWVC